MATDTKTTKTLTRPANASEGAAKAQAKATTKRAAKAATKPAARRFRVTLEKMPGTEATLFRLPFDVQTVYGTRGRVPVRGTINGFPYRNSIFAKGDGTHYMVVRKELREGAGVRGGQTVTVTMERDDEPRTVTPPAELSRALRRDRAAREAWDRLSYTHQREHAQSIEAAKRPETRARRVEKTLAQLAAKK